MSITLDGTNGVTASSPATIKASAYLDAAGGNTATINGVLVALASQAQAQAGTDNATLMTPLRVAQEIASLAAGVNIQAFTATGTYTPTAGYTWGIAFVTGGGGGGSSGTNAGAGGGGATAIGLLNLTTLGTVTATVGGAGSGTGSAGVNSTLSTLTGGGGGGGGSTVAGVGGTATGGVLNIRGADGMNTGNAVGGGTFWGSGGNFARPYGVGGSNGNGGVTGVSGVIMILEFK